MASSQSARANDTDTEHYRITRAFLTKTEKMLAVLLAIEENA
jgi:hypothetical protein